MKKKEKQLIDWCWDNLKFNNDPETWLDTYIVDILDGYAGKCQDINGKEYDYYQIRELFNL